MTEAWEAFASVYVAFTVATWVVVRKIGRPHAGADLLLATLWPCPVSVFMWVNLRALMVGSYRWLCRGLVA